MTVFTSKGLDLDDDDEYILDDQDEDLGLLDWDQYARIRRKRCCGMNCPDFQSLAPLWWYKLPKNRRRQLSAILPALAFVLLVGIIISFMFSGKGSQTSAAGEDDLVGANLPGRVRVLARQYATAGLTVIGVQEGRGEERRLGKGTYYAGSVLFHHGPSGESVFVADELDEQAAPAAEEGRPWDRQIG